MSPRHCERSEAIQSTLTARPWLYHSLRTAAEAFQTWRGPQARPADVKLLLSSTLFDANWYLNQYPDVASGDSDPVKHFLVFGGSERRNPSALFDTNKYLQLHPDVKETGLNPLVHYELHGRHEGREIVPVSLD